MGVDTRSSEIGSRYGQWTVLSVSAKRRHLRCRCECGSERDVARYSLKGGISQSCGRCGTVDVLAGQRFGKWTIHKVNEGTGIRSCICVCDCGNKRRVVTLTLTKGLSKSCGRCLDVAVGMRFGRWLVTDVTADNSSGLCRCRCDCGSIRVVSVSTLLLGRSKSCGCRRAIVSSEFNATHRMSKTATYRIWKGIHNRCNNPNVNGYANYGGRGIRVCDRWRESFEAFMADMGECPSSRHSIDRIDVNGHYEPSNCRWATSREQSRNTRVNCHIAANGQTRLLVEWSEVSGLSVSLIWARINRLGWSPDRAVSTPAACQSVSRTRVLESRED
jgi:hypothetical protein